MTTEEVKKKALAAKKKEKKPANPQDLTIDPATIKMIQRSRDMEIETIFDRAESMKPCNIGTQGTCCKNCAQGPCRLPLPKGGIEGEDTRKGLCGATPDTIAARNFARMVAGGAAAHSDHGRGVAETFLAAARKETEDYSIKDTKKLLEIAPDFGVDITVQSEDGMLLDRDLDEIAVELAEKAFAQWGQQQGEVCTVKRAPEARYQLWKKLGVVPRGIDREIVEIMHRTHIGVDQDYENILEQCSRAAIADGWGGSMIATDLQDVLFGCPYPVKSSANLGVLKQDHVNIVIHGHEPLLSEMIVQAAELPEMIELARAKGASGIQLSGICCTANEILMRHGVPLCGNFLQQELAIVTGAVDAMVVDVQCIMENIANVAQCFHTKIITTNPRAKIGSGDTLHVEFDEHTAFQDAKKIVTTAIENFPYRDKEVMIPDNHSDLIAGFSYEAINYHLGGTFRSSYTPLNDNIINGRIRGIGGVVG
jgi:carbon-monoxide dehydrogenase catalytic subunit